MLVQVCLELLTFIFLAQIFKMLYQLSLSFNLAKKDIERISPDAFFGAMRPAPSLWSSESGPGLLTTGLMSTF